MRSLTKRVFGFHGLCKTRNPFFGINYSFYPNQQSYTMLGAFDLAVYTFISKKLRYKKTK